MNKMLEFIKRYIKMWQCAGILASHCFLVSVRSHFGKATRNYVTNSLHRGGIKLLKCVNTNCEIIVDESYHSINKNSPKIFMSNHVSLFDLPLITANIPQHIRVVIKKELTKLPFIGKAALVSEQIIVDRQLIGDSKKFHETALKKLKSGISLWIFPEGTRSRNGELLPFKLGAFRLAIETGAEIIPVVITGTNHILPAGKLMPQLNKKTSIHVGKSINSKHYSMTHLKELAQEVEKNIRIMRAQQLL